MTAKHPAAFINAIEESRDFDLAIAQLQETWDEYCALKAASVKPSGPVAVRKLKWSNCPALGGRRKLIAHDCFGSEFYRIDLPTEDVETKKASAQAAYESLIRSALAVEPAPTASVGAMREACRQVAIVRATRCANDLATPPNIRGLGPDTHALEYGKRIALEIAHDIAALAAANQSDGGVEGHASMLAHDGDCLQAPAASSAGIKPGPSDTPPAPRAVETVSVDEVAADIHEVVDETRRQNWKNGGAHQYDSDEAAQMIARSLLAKFKMEGR